MLPRILLIPVLLCQRHTLVAFRAGGFFEKAAVLRTGGAYSAPAAVSRRYGLIDYDRSGTESEAQTYCRCSGVRIHLKLTQSVFFIIA